MSFAEQHKPLEGQNEQPQRSGAPVEKTTDLPTEQPNDTVTPAEEDPLQVLVDADEEQCLIEEAVLLNTKEAKTKEVMIEPPAIPKRNTLRSSRLLDSLRMNSIESATKSLNTPHSAYLSSEEDASSSADDDSDYDYDSSSEESEKSSARRGSQEVTARAVSVVFVGKPCMVNLANNRRSVSPPKRPQSEFFGRSVSSSFVADAQQLRPEYRKASLASIRDLPNDSPSFLSQDPFKDSPYTRRESVAILETTASTGPYPRPPRVPTGAFQRLSKTISLARKRSRPNLKAAAAASASMSSLNLPTLNTSQESQELADQSELTISTAPQTPQTPQTPTTYNDILRMARRNSTAASNITQSPPATARPASPPRTPITTKRGLLSGLAMNRRRSMRIKS